MDKLHYPSPEAEKSRYQEHLNDVNDAGFRKFVSPITTYVTEHFDPADSIGLDFGSGTAPVLSTVLKDLGYTIHLYDPFFSPQSDVLDLKYDYIACCEVIEHFHNPLLEFESLKNMLKPSGYLLCMTRLYHDQYPFKNWYYRRDPTHTFIFRNETIRFVAERFSFEYTVTNNRFITFKNR